MFSIMKNQRSPAEKGTADWTHNVGVARRIYLGEDSSNRCISHMDAINNLENKTLVDAQN